MKLHEHVTGFTNMILNKENPSGYLLHDCIYALQNPAKLNTGCLHVHTLKPKFQRKLNEILQNLRLVKEEDLVCSKVLVLCQLSALVMVLVAF